MLRLENGDSPRRSESSPAPTRSAHDQRIRPSSHSWKGAYFFQHRGSIGIIQGVAYFCRTLPFARRPGHLQRRFCPDCGRGHNTVRRLAGSCQNPPHCLRRGDPPFCQRARMIILGRRTPVRLGMPKKEEVFYRNRLCHESATICERGASRQPAIRSGFFM